MNKTSRIWKTVQLIGSFIIGYWFSVMIYGIIITVLVLSLWVGRTVLKRKQRTYVKESSKLIIALIFGYVIGVIWSPTEVTKVPIVIFIWLFVLIAAIIGTVIGLRQEK